MIKNRKMSIPFLIGTSHQVDELKSGIMELFNEVDIENLCADLETIDVIAQSRHLCMIAVPSHTIPGEILNFLQPYLDTIQSVRIFRHYSQPQKYLAVISLSSVENAAKLRSECNGKLVSSAEHIYCSLLPIKCMHAEGFGIDDVGMDIEERKSPVLRMSDMRESPKLSGHHRMLKVSDDDTGEYCPVCLEAFHSSFANSFSTCCNHKFHIDCIRKLESPQCPVCRFQHDVRAEVIVECFVCGWRGRNHTASRQQAQEPSDLWVCLICGFTGCGASHGNHMQQHYGDTLHSYAMNADTRRVWNFASGDYVHKLLCSDDLDGAMDFASRSIPQLFLAGHAAGGHQEEAIVHRKLEAAAYHYNQLLAWQMEQNRLSYETKLQRIRESVLGGGALAGEATGKKQFSKGKNWRESVILSLNSEKQKLQHQFDQAKERFSRARKELEVMEQLGVSYRANVGQWQSRVDTAKERLAEMKVTFSKEIPALEEQVTQIMEKLDRIQKPTGSKSEASTGTGCESYGDDSAPT